MTDYETTEINKEVYDRAQANGGCLTKEDKEALFSPSILWGYGLYEDRIYEEDGKYWLRYRTGSSCD